MIAISELYRSFSCRSTIYPITKLGFFKNKYLVLAVVSSLTILLLGMFVPALRSLFDIVRLGTVEILVLFAVASIGTISIELHKHFMTRTEQVA